MLRVRPTVFVSDLEPWSAFLEGLGMIRTVDEPDLREFDAGGGRIALRRRQLPGQAEDALNVVFGVEVGDPAEFVRRTVADGTKAVVVDGGRAADVAGRDGFIFRADKAAHGAVCADADPDLTVVGVWLTTDLQHASQDLKNIGARPHADASAGEADTGAGAVESPMPQEAYFTAKNGGVLAARAGTISGAEGETEADVPGTGGLEFEYRGGLDPLHERLAAAGIEARALYVGGPARRRALELRGPGGVKVMVREASGPRLPDAWKLPFPRDIVG
ncbi:VOC family protein [Arthrobacter sp. M4]|uniref:VOC family protein n=1 Tax=Arthrobacter sp. M4 TaxID=218160 RepID=UPI001CDBF28F|nr:VOC family protein [Arthrobacter sp. M4]MCA4134384.1 VOC family protein [Arthrobacter sp. M4]